MDRSGCAGKAIVGQPTPDNDETIVVTRDKPRHPAMPRTRSRVPILAGAGIAAVLAVTLAGWLLIGRSAPPRQFPAPTPAQVSPTRPPAPEFAIATATVDQVRQNEAADVSILRLMENPHILVLDFASLSRQGRMLDRLAALIEKIRLPRDRILNPGELIEAIRTGGDMESGFYYGHDYSAASVGRFYEIADRDKIGLTAEEAMLRRLLDQEGWFNPGTQMGVISLPRVGADGNVTVDTRNVILTHELSHGEYFSNPAYAEYVNRFWRTVLTAREQEGFRKFLSNQGYDTDNAELLENETQAYLIFTTDPRFFKASQAGLTPARRAELRAAFTRDMPSEWLKNNLPPLPK